MNKFVQLFAPVTVVVAVRDQLVRTEIAREATKLMFTGREAATYNGWGSRMPIGRWNFAANANYVPICPRKRSRFEEFAAALGILYGKVGITSEQAKGWAAGNSELMPICVARVKIPRAMRNIFSEGNRINHKEIVERTAVN